MEKQVSELPLRDATFEILSKFTALVFGSLIIGFPFRGAAVILFTKLLCDELINLL